MNVALPLPPAPRPERRERLLFVVRQRVEVLAAAVEARRAALAQGYDAGRAEGLALVVAELGGNAVRYAHSGVVAITVGAGGWTVEVEDSGPGFPPAVLADAGRSDRLGADGVRPPGDGRRSFGSGLASVRRLATALELSNRRSGGGLAVAHREFPPSPPRKDP